MNLQPAMQSRSSNGFVPRRIDGEIGSQVAGAKTSYGLPNGGLESSSHDRLIFASTCLIGRTVEVHVKDGSVLSGIFHTINAEDFGVVLKMARVTKEGSLRGAKPLSETVKRPQTMIIPSRELMQVIAKGISLSHDGISGGSIHEKRQDMMTDSAISQSRRVDVGRELERWMPDEDDLQRPELENIFDKQWNRSWNQFEANEALFGVKSTFNEELYTTKLYRGPQTRNLEREAMRIAREIEGEDTKDLHLAEERGIHLDEEFDFDEETRFSSVYRGGIGAEVHRVNEDITGAEPTSSNSSRDEGGSTSLEDLIKGVPRSDSGDRHVPPKTCDNEGLDGKQHDAHQGGRNVEKEHRERAVTEDTSELLKFEDAQKSSTEKGGLSASAAAYSPSSGQEKKDLKGPPETASGGEKVSLSPQARPSSSASSASEKSVETSTSSGLVGSVASEKSTLNPHAKEFKLNPNAKSFVPSSSARPHALAADSSIYYPHNQAISPMHGLPMGVNMGPTFPGQQPVMYNPQGLQMQAPQGYISPAGSLYGQQMIMGQPRPVIYMQGFPQDVPYKGREF